MNISQNLTLILKILKWKYSCKQTFLVTSCCSWLAKRNLAHLLEHSGKDIIKSWDSPLRLMGIMFQIIFGHTMYIVHCSTNTRKWSLKTLNSSQLWYYATSQSRGSIPSSNFASLLLAFPPATSLKTSRSRPDFDQQVCLRFYIKCRDVWGHKAIPKFSK